MEDRQPRPRPKFVEKLEARREDHLRRGIFYRIVFGVAGAIVLLAGVIMLVTPGPAFVLIPIQVASACLVAICFLKGKLMTAGIGLFVPIVALVGALRPAKPGSRWTRRRPAAAT